ncbi:MAG: PspC domain-containing protein, partial [Bacteroidota bacterium]
SYMSEVSKSSEMLRLLLYDDIEKIREIEEEEEKDQNGKLGSAGMMALVAGVTVLVGSIITQTIGLPELFTQIIEVIVPAIGFGAMAYGFIKMINLAFRRKELNFPALNVYRKTKPTPPPTSDRTRTSARNPRSASTARERYQQRARARSYQTQTDPNRKVLRRSRTNRVFSGVAGGLAEYTNISVTLIRFAFIVGIFMGFPIPIFIYLLLSIVLPANFDGGFDGGTGSSRKPPRSEDIPIS